jgi:HemY protein
VLIIVVGIWLLGLVLRAPWKIAGRQSRSRRERGQHAISMGLVAIAAGDREEARRQSKRAAQLVPDQPLATLLAAQTAQLEGDEQAAHSYFTKLAETPNTAFLGLRGLWMQAMKDGRTREALHFVEQAHAEQPNAAWVLEAQLTLQARLGQWDAASQSLETLAKHKLRAPEKAKEARALINVERSRAAANAEDTAAALDAALVAYKANPALVPAVAQLALMQIASNRRGRAEKVLKDAWRAAPHPMLVESFRGVVSTVSADKQLDLARSLASLNPNAADSHIMVARFAMAAEQWNAAEEALAPLTRRNPSVRVCHLMAEIEADGRNNREAARDWLARAASAAPDEAWVCSESGAVQSNWSAVCQASQLFGTLEWRVPYHVEQHAPIVLEGPAAASSTVLAPAGVANNATTTAPVVVDAIAEPVSDAEKKGKS